MQSQTKRIIEVDHVWMRYDDKVILSDISLHVDKGDFIAITGPNGGGKTTLLRLILKLLTPSKGSVRYFNREGAETSHIPIGYLPQKNMIDSHFPITVREVIRSGVLSLRIDRAERDRRTAEAMEMMGLTEHAEASIGRLSGGQMQRALLGRAIISKPEVLVLDEPLSYVDKRFEHHLYELIEEISRHTTVILVSHEMTTIAGMANRHLIVDHSIHECTAANHRIITSCDD
ncbi:MAG: ATP-binding cassette domain-containing protein [Muribaculum sp.]|nr:ATP-binding cassette domain-containing protein [Muribaculum sp.]